MTMTDIQFYIVVALPILGILTNTGLYLHLSSRMENRFALVHQDMKDLNKAMTALETDVALLKDKVGMK